MTQPLPLAQTGLSSQGTSLFGSARALETKWRLGNSELIPSAGAAASKANPADKKADFAQTLREKKQSAAESDRPAEPKPNQSNETERTSRVDASKSHAKRTKKSEETAKAEGKKAADKKADDKQAEESSASSETDEASAAEQASQSKEAAKNDQSDEASAKEQAAAQVQTAAAQENPAVAAAKTEDAAQAGDAAQSEAESTPQDTKQVETAPGDPGTPNAAVVATAVAAQAAPKPNQGTAPSTESSGARNTATKAVEQKASDRQADQNAVRVEASAGRGADAATTKAATDAASAASKNVDASAARRAKTTVPAKSASQAASEAPEPASKSGAQARVERAQAAADGHPVQDDVTDAEPAPLQSAAPIVEPIAQGKAIEFNPGATSAQREGAPVEAIDTAAATTASSQIERMVASPQPTPSAELLRALSPTPGATNIGSTPPQQATPQAAENPDYQRLLGQQVERGITQAIQQAAASTDAMITGTGAVVLRLHPANLGQIKVQIKFEGAGGTGVRARFEASSSRAKGILGDSIDSLKTALEGRGLRVDEVVVAQSPRMPEPDLGSFVPGPGQHGGSGPGDAGTGFAGRNDQPAPSFGALASGDSRLGAAESGNDIPTGGLGEQPVWLTGAAGWTIDANGLVRVDALV